jgi:hypothetical protein
MLAIRRVSPTKLISESAWCTVIALAGVAGGILVSPLAGREGVADTPRASSTPPREWTMAPVAFRGGDRVTAMPAAPVRACAASLAVARPGH